MYRMLVTESRNLDRNRKKSTRKKPQSSCNIRRQRGSHHHEIEKTSARFPN